MVAIINFTGINFYSKDFNILTILRTIRDPSNDSHLFHMNLFIQTVLQFYFLEGKHPGKICIVTQYDHPHRSRYSTPH